MKFDRYEILTNKYRKEIEDWNWKEIKKSALENVIADYDGNVLGSCFIGTVFGVMPSGKFYMPWTTNQTRSDVIRDSCFMDALEEIAEKHGMFVTNSEADSCDMLIQCIINDPSEVISYVSKEDEEKALEYFSQNA